MALDLVTLNQALDAVLKIVALAAVVIIIVFFKHFDRLVKSFERSAESMERTTETVEDVVRVARYLPFIGRKNDE
ncbi:MAG: hypothetical protein ABEJ98_03485 [Candidatus Nanohaloarchaea archaeon]